MLDPQTYRANERIAKSMLPSWRIAQIHNVDLFEKVGFPVRIESIHEVGQLVDTMQENRFDRYMAEFDGLSKDEYRQFIEACMDIVRFQQTYLPNRPPVIPLSTLISAYAIFLKIRGAVPDFRSVLELGPGCGYVSFFLKQHASLENYSQIEACESFYILQNLVNLFCFSPRFDERALLPKNIDVLDHFTNASVNIERSLEVRLGDLSPACTHYPWWRIGEIITYELKFDVVTSNANLLEFSPDALDDYLTLTHRSLNAEGVFLFQCTGFEANGSLETLFDKLYEKQFAPVTFVKEGVPVNYSGGSKGAVVGDFLNKGARASTTFTTNNGLFVKTGHPLFDKYYKRMNFRQEYIAPEEIVKNTYFSRPNGRKIYTAQEILEATELALKSGD